MIKTSAAALLLSTALMTGAVMAQTSTTTGTSATTAQPATTMNQPAASASAAAGSTQFLTQQDRDQFRASKFVGLAIYGQDNQRIGDINEILIDKTGDAKAVVIGVGGFLGIGEKNVAVPFSAVEWVFDRPATAAAAGSGTNASGSNMAANTNPPAGTSASAGMATSATTASTGTTAAARDTSVTGSTSATQNRSPAEAAAANGYPDHGKVRMTKADLQNAPSFKYFGETQSNANRPANAPAPATGTAPRQ